MDDTPSRVRRVIERLGKLKHKRENHAIELMSGFCLIAAVCLVRVVRPETDSESVVSVPGFAGSSLMLQGAEGYVLAGILAFTVGVAVTLICVRYRK